MAGDPDSYTLEGGGVTAGWGDNNTGTLLSTVPCEYLVVRRVAPSVVTWITICAVSPGAISLGADVEEARRNLDEAIEMVLEGNRLLAEDVAREKISSEEIAFRAA